jgi:hypothetical protein
MSKLPYISPELLQSYQTQIAKQATPATIKRKSASLKHFFDWATENGHISENPLGNPRQITKDVKMPTRRLTAKSIFQLGILGTMIVLIFLLGQKLKIPIPFIKTPASTQEITGISSPIIPMATPITQQTTILSPWKLYTKLTLTDSSGNPAVGSQTITFKIYKNSDDPTSLWTSESQIITTDTNGSSLISLDSVPTDLFFKNEELYLEANLGGSPSGSRIPVSTANVAANLGGFFPASPTEGAGPSTIPVLSENGSLLLTSESPAVKATNGNLLVEGQAVLISTPNSSDGNITINPDGNGITQFLFEGTGKNFLNVQAPNLTSGSLFYGVVANNATDYDLLRLQSGSSKITRFSVDALGNTNLAGALSTSGYSQASDNFSITQTAGDTATITKSSTALSNVLTLMLDERGKANSDYSTLTLKRYNGSSNAYALWVDEGNARFDEQVQIGQFASNPNAIGQGSLVFNTSDNKVYVWDGSTWTALGTGGSLSFTSITSGTNTSAAMVVGSGASLSFTGTGTISTSGTGVANFASTGQVTFAGNVDATNGLDVTGDVYISSGISTFLTAVSDGTIEATKFCTGDGETNCVTDFGIISGGAAIWTDAGTYIYPTNGEVLGNAASAGVNKIAGIYLADSSPFTMGSDNDIDFSFSGTTLAVTQGNNDINFDGDTLFIDGSDNRVGIGTTAPGNKLTVTAPTTADTTTDVMIGTSATTQTGLVIQGKASQSTSLQEWQNSAGTVMLSVNQTGGLVLTASAGISYPLFISGTNSGALGSSSRYNIYSSTTWSGPTTGSQSPSIISIETIPEISGTHNTTGQLRFIGLDANPNIKSTITAVGATSYMAGISTLPTFTGTGTFPTVYGVYAGYAENNASAVITNGYGIYVQNPNKTDGTITNNLCRLMQ